MGVYTNRLCFEIAFFYSLSILRERFALVHHVLIKGGARDSISSRAVPELRESIYMEKIKEANS